MGRRTRCWAGQSTGWSNGDAITVTYATPATTGSAAGTYPIVPSLVDPNGRLANYNVSTNNGMLTVVPAVLGITANSTNRIYGTTNPVFTYSASGFVKRGYRQCFEWESESDDGGGDEQSGGNVCDCGDERDADGDELCVQLHERIVDRATGCAVGDLAGADEHCLRNAAGNERE